MSSKNYLKMRFLVIFVLVLLTACKPTIEKYTLSSCKAVETNITKCSQLIADDISDKKKNTQSFVDEGNL